MLFRSRFTIPQTDEFKQIDKKCVLDYSMNIKIKFTHLNIIPMQGGKLGSYDENEMLPETDFASFALSAASRKPAGVCIKYHAQTYRDQIIH